MLSNITLKNFKCFETLSLPVAPLTLLTGFNAAGKSTVLQSILLLSQALRTGGLSPEIPLNGKLVRIGTPGEVLNSGSGELVFAAEDDQAAVEWTLHSADRRRGLYMKIRQIAVKDKNGVAKHNDKKSLNMLLPPGASKEVKNLVKRLRETVFLSALRIGTEDVFPSPEESLPVHADVGSQGEYAPWLFHQFIDEDIPENRCNTSDEARSLRRQFKAWASELFPGAQANTLTVERTNLIRLELRISDTGEWRRPSNIGYGLTYAFPVIVAGLLAKKGQILIIDSPEAHLHPSGQSQMGKFLACMAAAGVQIIIETHSDHVLNGVRLAVNDGIISPEKTAMHFFNSHEIVSKGSAKVFSPAIDLKGNLSEWPEGFFDQSEKDMARLAGWI